MTGAKCRVAAVLSIAFGLTLMSRPALGQQTDERWLVALGFVPFAVRSDHEPGSGPSEDSSRWHVGVGTESALQLGYGLGPVVIGLDVLFGISEETYETVDVVSSASVIRVEVSSVEIGVGPNVRYLFLEGGLRPFVEAGGGVASLHRDQSANEIDAIKLWAHVGPGMQVQILDAVSFDALLRVRYGYATGESTLKLRVAAESIDAQSDISADTLELALHARVSLWL